jgi:spore germination protein (amino acid permease)
VALPKIMGAAAGTGAWFTMFLGAIFFSFNVSIIVYLGRVYKGKTLFEYSQLLVGKAVTYCFTAIYAVYFTIILAFVIRTSADTIKTEILYRTPVLATMLLMTVIALYTASKGLTNIGRIVEFLGLIILVIGFILSLLTFKEGNMLNILPLFDYPEKNMYFTALPLTIFAFLRFEVITVIPLNNVNSHKTLRTAVIAIFVLYLFSMIVVESCFSILGIDDIANYKYPLISAIRRLDIAILQFAKRLDLFFIIAWLFSIFCSISMLIFTASEYARRLIPKSRPTVLLIIICVLACSIGIIIPNSEVVSEYFLRFTMYVGLLPSFVIPFILFMIHIFKFGKKTKAHPTQVFGDH